MEIWDEVVQEFNQEIERLKASLGDGAAEDFAHYRQLVGSIQGLDWARTNLTEIIKKRMYEEDYSTKDDMSYLTTVGKVIALGELAYKDVDKFPNGGWCNIGDYVCYGKHAGTKLYYQNVKLLLLFDDQVIMRVSDPKDLDPTFNLGRH